MNDSQRRLLVRSIFVAGCLLPTAACLAWSLSRGGDRDRTDWEHRLTTHLGLRTQIESIGFPRPGAVLLERLRCYDSETDALVVDARAIEIESSGDGFVVRASQPEIFADRGARLFEAIERRLRREFVDAESTARFEAAELTWHVPGQSQTLVDVAAVIGSAESSQQLVVNFALSGSNAQEPVALRIKRSTAVTPPETVVDLDTGATPLPCSALAPLHPAAGALGRRASYLGKIRLRHLADGWHGTIAGEITELDLAALVERHLPHVLAGTATVQIHRADVAAGRLHNCEFSMLGGPGQISSALMASAAYHLALGDPRAAADLRTTIPYDGLEFDLSLDESGIKLASRRPDARRPMLWRGDLVYWQQPPAQLAVQPTANLLRALAPEQELMVPAARQAAALLELLPLPQRSVMRTPDVETRPIDMKLRVREPTGNATPR